MAFNLTLKFQPQIQLFSPKGGPKGLGPLSQGMGGGGEASGSYWISTFVQTVDYAKYTMADSGRHFTPKLYV
jgi:hypothetical protein